MTERKLRFGAHRVQIARNVRVPIKSSSVGAKSPSRKSSHSLGFSANLIPRDCGRY